MGPSQASRRRTPPTRAAGSDGVATTIHHFGGAGPVLFFAHATGMHAWVWKPVADLLADRARCVAVDLRGHGDSPLPSGAALSWDRFGRDVLAAVRSLGADAVIGVGHSLGGAALLMAELEAPGTFQQLFLYEPAVHVELGEHDGESMLGMRDTMVEITARRRATFPSLADARAHFASKPPMARFHTAVLDAYVSHGFSPRSGAGGDFVELKCLPTIEAQIYAGFERNTAGFVHAITCPVTWVTGAATDAFQRQTVQAFAAQFASSPVVLPGVDHFGPMQEPEQFADAVARHVLPA